MTEKLEVNLKQAVKKRKLAEIMDQDNVVYNPWLDVSDVQPEVYSWEKDAFLIDLDDTLAARMLDD